MLFSWVWVQTWNETQTSFHFHNHFFYVSFWPSELHFSHAMAISGSSVYISSYPIIESITTPIILLVSIVIFNMRSIISVVSHTPNHVPPTIIGYFFPRSSIYLAWLFLPHLLSFPVSWSICLLTLASSLANILIKVCFIDRVV